MGGPIKRRGCNAPERCAGLPLRQSLLIPDINPGPRRFQTRTHRLLFRLLFVRHAPRMRSPIVDMSAPLVVQTVPWTCMITAEEKRVHTIVNGHVRGNVRVRMVQGVHRVERRTLLRTSQHPATQPPLLQGKEAPQLNRHSCRYQTVLLTQVPKLFRCLYKRRGRR